MDKDPRISQKILEKPPPWSTQQIFLNKLFNTAGGFISIEFSIQACKAYIFISLREIRSQTKNWDPESPRNLYLLCGNICQRVHMKLLTTIFGWLEHVKRKTTLSPLPLALGNGNQPYKLYIYYLFMLQHLMPEKRA